MFYFTYILLRFDALNCNSIDFFEFELVNAPPAVEFGFHCQR